jgi:hypothetical protein
LEQLVFWDKKGLAKYFHIPAVKMKKCVHLDGRSKSESWIRTRTKFLQMPASLDRSFSK